MTTSRLQAFDAAGAVSGRSANRLLFGWLCDDDERRRLYDEMHQAGRTALKFTSVEGQAYGKAVKDVYVLADRTDIETAFKHFSVAPYAALGGGKFMLAIDELPLHDRQRELAARDLRYDHRVIRYCVQEAFRKAAILPLKQRHFDVASLAEQAALRFVALLFGIPADDYVVLTGTMQRGYTELCFRIIGRHFDDELEPRRALPPDVKDLSTRLEMLLVQSAPEDTATATKRRKDKSPAFETVIERFRNTGNGYDAEMLAVILLGLMGGTVGNVQAAVTNALADFFAAGTICEAQRCARADDDQALGALVMAALTRNPPAAFLARRADGQHVHFVENGKRDVIPKGADVLLAVGAAGSDDLVFGGPATDRSYVHQCVGEHLAKPLALYIVKQLVLLPGLAQVIDADSGKPHNPKKRWGIVCQKYPLQYDRARRLNKQPLMVVMRIKKPIAEYAEKLGRLIAAGAPAIEDALRESGHVHVA